MSIFIDLTSVVVVLALIADHAAATGKSGILCQRG
jgi:hypothetical protein